MLKIREFATSKEKLFVQTYIYLQEAKHNKFFNNRTVTSVWSELAEAKCMAALCVLPPRIQSLVTPVDALCSLCRSRTFHKWVTPFPGVGSSHCPLLPYKTKIAKLVRDQIIAAADAPGKDIFDAAFMQPHIEVVVSNAQANSIFNSIQYLIQFNSIQYSIHFNSYLFKSYQFNLIQVNSIQFNSIHFDSIQFDSFHFNSIQFN